MSIARGDRRETYFADDRHEFPHRLLVGTEDNGVRGVRGEYHFGPLVGGGVQGGRVDPGMGPLGALYVADTIRPAELWKFVATRDYVIGDFTWTGFDYLGESRWPNKLATSGALDTCGFKKDGFYFYQSQWTQPPMVHLLPHWNWEGREGEVIPVVAYANCDTVELFLNGRSLGAKAKEFPRQGTEGGWNTYARPVVRGTTADLQLVWDVPYAPGELRAVGWKEGKRVVEDVVQTAGAATALAIRLERSELSTGPREVVHVAVRAVDAAGRFVPRADDLVTCTVSGPARLLAVDNGDPTSHDGYQVDTRRLFNGRALAIVQKTGGGGAVHVTVKASGLAPASADFIFDAR